LQTFVFLVLALESAAEYTRSVVVATTALIVAALLIVAHAVAAQRRIYGEPWLKTLLKAVAVAGVYGVLWGASSFGASLMAARG